MSPICVHLICDRGAPLGVLGSLGVRSILSLVELSLQSQYNQELGRSETRKVFDYDEEFAVLTSNDDAEEISGVIDLKEIDEMKILFTAEDVGSDATTLNFYLEQHADCSDFSQELISTRDWGTSFVSWSPGSWNSIGDQSYTPDLSSLLDGFDEIDSWVEGSALCVLISGSGKRVAESYDGNSSLAAKLRIKLKDQVTTLTTEETVIEQFNVRYESDALGRQLSEGVKKTSLEGVQQPQFEVR